MSPVLVGLVAIGAAGCFAVSNALQHHAASQAPRSRAIRATLLWQLLHRPVWLAGIAADLIGVGLHALALHTGALTLVQPLLVSALLLALPISRLVTGRRITLADYGWASLVVGGLSMFLLTAHPTGGHSAASGTMLITGLASAAALCAVAIAAAQRRGCTHRAALLGVATGVACGMVAALTKQVTTLALAGLPTLLTTWPVYALLAVGAVSLLLGQAAYQAGPLTASLPAITIVDPIVAIGLGLLGFGEALAAGPALLAVAAAGFVTMTVGVVALARRAGDPEPESQARRSRPEYAVTRCADADTGAGISSVPHAGHARSGDGASAALDDPTLETVGLALATPSLVRGDRSVRSSPTVSRGRRVVGRWIADSSR